MTIREVHSVLQAGLTDKAAQSNRSQNTGGE